MRESRVFIDTLSICCLWNRFRLSLIMVWYLFAVSSCPMWTGRHKANASEAPNNGWIASLPVGIHLKDLLVSVSIRFVFTADVVGPRIPYLWIRLWRLPFICDLCNRSFSKVCFVFPFQRASDTTGTPAFEMANAWVGRSSRSCSFFVLKSNHEEVAAVTWKWVSKRCTRFIGYSRYWLSMWLPVRRWHLPWHILHRWFFCAIAMGKDPRKHHQQKWQIILIHEARDERSYVQVRWRVLLQCLLCFSSV